MCDGIYRNQFYFYFAPTVVFYRVAAVFRVVRTVLFCLMVCRGLIFSLYGIVCVFWFNRLCGDVRVR